MPGIHIPRRSLRRISLGGFYDDFNRADSATLGVSTSGHTWERLINGFAIAGNKAYQATDFGLEVIDSGISDGYIQADITFNGNCQALAFRATDNLNYMCISFDQIFHRAWLVKFQGGVFSTFGSIVIPAMSGLHVIKVTFIAQSIGVLVDGVSIGITVGPAFNLTATKHGIGRQAHASDNTSTYDNVVCAP